jgi:hypothetical protein
MTITDSDATSDKTAQSATERTRNFLRVISLNRRQTEQHE